MNMITTINTNFVIRLTKAVELTDEQIEAIELGELKQPRPKVDLIGAGQLHKVIGPELARGLFNKALDCRKQIYTRKLRRGLKIEFHSK